MGKTRRRYIAPGLVAILALFAFLVPLHAAQAAQTCAGSVSNFHWKKGSDFVDYVNGIAKIAFDWEVKKDANPQDTFTVTLPDQLKPHTSSNTFDLRDENGDVVANATWQGKQVTFTLTEYARNHGHIKGDAFFTVTWDEEQVRQGEEYNLQFRTCEGPSNTIKGKVLETGPGGHVHGNAKTGHLTSDNQLRWYLGIATAQKGPWKTPVSIVDRGGQGYKLSCEGVTVVNRVVNGSYVKDHPIDDARYRCTEDATGGIHIDLLPLPGAIYINDGESLVVIMRAELLPGYKDLDELVNTAELSGTPEGDASTSANVSIPGAGGSAHGKQARFSLKKDVVGGQGADTAAAYEFSYKCLGDGFEKFAALKAGQTSDAVTTRSSAVCQIREDNLPEGATVSYEVLNPDSGATVTMENGVATLRFEPNAKAEVKLRATNKLADPKKISISGEKLWDDDGDRDGKRPAEVTIRLLKNKAIHDTRKVKADSTGKWTFAFDGLAESENGKPIDYTIEEVRVDGYEAPQVHKTGETTFTVTNKRVPEVVDIPVIKKWEGDTGFEGRRPAEVVVRLLADGEEVDRKAIHETNGEWAYIFVGKPKYAKGKQGQPIQYKVEEVDVPTGYSPLAAEHGGTWTITNTLTKRPGSVTWTKVDSDSVDNKLGGSEWLLKGPGQVSGGTPIVDCIAASSDACGGPDKNPAKGEFRVDGLDWGTYTLTEALAPAGYIVDDTPREFVVDGTGNPDLPITLGHIKNQKVTAPLIPLTGGMSRDAYLYGGALTMLLGMALTFAIRRRA
ncbi:Cna B-type domain-containing protein [Trueperella pecoris]|uniref:Cna B-type domain-containing protein n=1 Tax=Trueperella pecoris TaxID=2733571 RepID=A0A7M1R147_9ACTO|nr:Cna B-type domain-containing protein [Trueperella pecoris]QOR47999.1 Cna B-type domain-containing protein [Trueperella pecoris]